MHDMAGWAGGAPARRGEIAFDRAAPGLSGIVVKGFLLSLVTFGIYRFWYITNLRRFFWSRTVVAGSPGEYVGRGKELFLGFLVALAILIPVYLVLFILGFAVPALAPFAGLITFVFLFLLGQYAIFRGRRYRASRTLWRGIRLAQDGSAAFYVLMAAGWWLLTIASLGLAFPFMRASLERYRINHTLVGESRMHSTARGTSVLMPWLLFYALGIVPTVALVAVWLAKHGFVVPADLIVTEPGSGKGHFNPAYLKGLETILQVYGIAVATTLPIAILLIPYYRAREARAFLDAASLAGARLTSTLRARQFYWPYIVYFLSLLGFGLVAAFVVGGTAVLIGTGGSSAVVQVLGVALLGALYIGTLLVFAVLYVRVITARLWHAVATTTAIENAEALEAVLASSRRPGSGLNEGLADALDVGGALEIGF